MKRALLPAIAAIVVLIGAAIVVWDALVSYVAGAVTTQWRLAGELLDAGAPTGATLAKTLQRPGVFVRVIDLRTGALVEAGSEGIAAHAGPPPGAFPEGGPPPGGPPPHTQGPLVAAALALARIPPEHIERTDRVVDIIPDGRELGIWLILDVGVVALAVIAVVLVAVGNGLARARRERSRLEAHATERSEAAERYQRFLADTGHELRTPLTVLAGYVEILRGRSADESVDVRILEGMHAETSRMRVLVEKMMTLARLESQVAVPRLVDVGTAVRQAAQTLQRRFPDRAVRVSTERTGSIVIDADDVAAALGNLLENAEKYAPESPISIATDVRDGQASVAVVDHGPGIDAAARATIFERFVRGRDRAYGEGLGLGLAIVKRVADRWNGTIECTSENGTTTFVLAFPLANEERHELAR
jgi:signal transduction histidine kinase